MAKFSEAILKDSVRSRVDGAAEYIRDHYGEDLKLDKLAAFAHLSKFHFHRLFRSRFGKTVRDYLRQVRLNQALNMLVANADFSISEVADRCGFSSSQNFARAFKAYFGFTPTFVRSSQRMVPQTSPYRVMENAYRSQLHRATTYLRDHYAEEIHWDDLSKIIGFSRFHFHRIFRARYGETIREYIGRIRLEASAYKLTTEQCISVTEIAYSCGFSSSQQFARAFKVHFGLPPSLVRNGFHLADAITKRGEILAGDYGRKYLLTGKEREGGGTFIELPLSGKNQETLDLEVVKMPSCRVAYIRIKTSPGSEVIEAVMNRILQWAAPKGLFMNGSLLFGAFWGDPDSKGQLIYQACVSIPETITADEDHEVRCDCLQGGEYGVYHGRFHSLSEIPLAWERLFRSLWMSSYFPRDLRPSYEIYYNDGSMEPSRTWIVDLCLPITTLHGKRNHIKME